MMVTVLEANGASSIIPFLEIDARMILSAKQIMYARLAPI